MRIYGLKNCDTCRKAVKALPNFEFVDLRAEPLSHEILAAAQARFGDALLNTRSTTWRGLSAGEREQPALDLLKAHAALMKRPLIVTESEMYLGWTPETQKALGVA